MNLRLGKTTLIGSLLLVSSTLQAQEYEGLYVGFTGNSAITEGKLSNTNEKITTLTGYGAEGTIGYFFTDTFALEASHGVVQNLLDGDDLSYSEIMSTADIPISDYVDLYLGVGASYFDDAYSLAGKVGLSISLNSSVRLNGGYKFYQGNDSWDNSIGQFQLGLSYFFNPIVEEVEEEYEPYVQPEPEIIVKEVVKEKEVIKEVRVDKCSASEPYEYVIQPDEWIRKILIKENVSYNKFIELNGGDKDWSLVYPGDSIKLPRKCE
ncbi:porin family protein [Vibrio alginolyticus]|uniref:porin family protein n=1 Tax=Vibrio TaxID=662 RepID=UPI00102DC23C|nr:MULTISPECIES: porin family protein [Vibrio]EMB9236009.1 porin family protein [Vibrio alginolyticus]MCF7509473.1 porin family protein [Vibrio sp. D54]RZV16125.1 porin family protein [Vibrio alginolyticus]